MSRHVLSLLVEDKPGLLTRVAGLFARRGFNIESLTVGHTETPGVSRMTIVVDTDELGARRVEANLYKLLNVLRVDNITGRSQVVRDLALIKVSAPQRARTGRVSMVRGQVAKEARNYEDVDASDDEIVSYSV